MKKHWDYLIARFGAYPVVWTLCGEVTLAYYSDLGASWPQYKDQFRTQWSEVARHIQQNDPFNRLLTVHPGPGIHDGQPPIYDMEALDMIMLQSGHKGFQTIPESYRFIKKYQQEYPKQPVIHGEVCFEGMFGSSLHDVQRFLFWSNVLLGTPGYSYGAEGIWQFNTESELFGASPSGSTWGNVPWNIAAQYEGSKQLGFGKKLLEKYDWWKLEKAPQFISEYVSDDNILNAPYCAASEKVILIYFTKTGFIKGRTFLKNLNPNESFSFYFFDPITGKEYPQEKLEPLNGNWTIPTPPIMQDWVLVIERK